jgi:hypothetical protein
MGALEVVDIVLTHATAVSSLALAVVAWRQARGKPESITITRPDGRQLTIRGGSDLAAEVIAEFLAGDTGGPAGELPREAD